MNNFTIFTASAGSGKTTQLVSEYLSLAFLNPTKFKSILAITFTNNATAEMKERIIETLHTLAFSSPSEYSASDLKVYDSITNRLQQSNKPSHNISELAKEILTQILYDYDNFSISTIDSFFQRIIRAFSLEFGLNLNFNLEISLDELYEQAINLLIHRLSHNETELVTKVHRLIEDKMDESGKWDIESALRDIIAEIFNEETALLLNKSHEQFAQLDFTNETQIYYEKLKELQETKQKCCDQIKKIINDNNLTQNKKSNIDKKIEEEQNFDDFIEGIINGLKKKPLSENLKNELNTNYQKGHKASQDLLKLKFIYKNLHSTALIIDLKEIIDEIRERDNIFYLSEANQLIQEKIEKEDTPFIYEKIGNKYSNFFIDEFQDTSRLQWENLIPLIKNALGMGGEIKIFGDVKQSIYRFRNGDPSLLQDLSTLEGYNQQLQNYDPLGTFHNKDTSLDTNYRSAQSIVSFNNQFFDYLIKDKPTQIKEFYEDLKQNIKSNEEGFVSIRFKDNAKMKNDEFFIEETFKIVENLRAKGISLNDIAILCSGNQLINQIGKRLAEGGYAILSQESLLLSQSEKIQLITAVLRIIENNNDTISQFIVMQNILKKNGGDITELHKQFSQKFDFNAFTNFLAENNIQINFTTLKNAPLFTRINLIIQIFNINQEEDSFLTTYLDLVHKQLNSQGFKPENFIAWWDKNCTKLTLPAPKGMDAITLSTVHKAKGLAYPYVIFPFSQFGTKKTKSTKWFPAPENSTSNDITTNQPYFWATLKKEAMPEEYEKFETSEAELTKLDNINKIYVANTRPRYGLYLITTNKGEYAKTLLNFIENHTKNTLDIDLKCNSFYFYNEKFHNNPPETLKRFSSPTQSHTTSKTHNAPFTLNSSQLALTSNYTTESIKEGNIIHEFLAKIEIFPETQEEINLLLQTISPEYHTKLRHILQELTHHRELKPYFSKNNRVLNETSILTKEHHIYRPDRIVFMPTGEIVVIDYKTGEYHTKHQEQLDNYCQLIREMGYPNVIGKLIFIKDNLTIY